MAFRGRCAARGAGGSIKTIQWIEWKRVHFIGFVVFVGPSPFFCCFVIFFFLTAGRWFVLLLLLLLLLSSFTAHSFRWKGLVPTTKKVAAKWGPNSAIFLGFRSVRRDWSKWSTPHPPKRKKAANQLRSSTQRWWKSNFRAPAPVWLSLTNYRLPTMPKYRYSGSDHVPLVLTFEAPSFFFSTNKTRCQLSITNQGSSFKYRYLKSNPQLVFKKNRTKQKRNAARVACPNWRGAALRFIIDRTSSTAPG